MGRDSNSRWTFAHSGFQDRRLRPLGHPSKTNEKTVLLTRIIHGPILTRSASEDSKRSYPRLRFGLVWRTVRAFPLGYE